MLPLPWTFNNARVLYQPTFVPVDAARAVTPAVSGLKLLSLFGWTLGGVFVVDWAESPIGPYREVAVLSGLVARGFSIGAWASHIVVTTPEAREAGRDLFGLPAVLGSIELAAASREADVTSLGSAARDIAVGTAVAFKVAIGTALPGVAEPAERLGRAPSTSSTSTSITFEADDAIRVQGWESWNVPEGTQERERGPALTLSLPSFAGCLDEGMTEGGSLLRYPLTLGPARRVRLLPAMRTILPGGADAALLSKSVRAALGGPCACPCIAVDGVTVVAGTPVELQ